MINEKLSQIEVTHFRLCHLCLTLNESAGEIIQCRKCNHFFGIEGMDEDEALMENVWIESEQEDEEESPRIAIPNRKVYTGVHGLSVIW